MNKKLRYASAGLVAVVTVAATVAFTNAGSALVRMVSNADAAAAVTQATTGSYDKSTYDYAALRSVTVVFGTCNDVYCPTLYNSDPAGELALFKQEIARIKDTGFNTVWIPAHWLYFEPTALPTAKYDDAMFSYLRQKLDILRANNMQAIIGLNYYGAGWSPAGIQPGYAMVNDPKQYAAFEAYVQEFLTRISDYPDVAIPLVFTESTEMLDTDLVNGVAIKDGVKCGTKTYTSGYDYTYSECFRETYAAKLRATLGSLPARLPAALKKFRFGYHDYTLINLGWGKGSYPVPSPSPYDFLSAIMYPEYWDDAKLAKARTNPAQLETDLAAELATRIGRFKKQYPGVPVIVGESGRATCYTDAAPGGDAEQAVVVGAIVKAALAQKFGFNIWDWSFARGYATKNGMKVPWACNSLIPHGYDLLKADGTPREAVAAIKKLLTARVKSGGTLSSVQITQPTAPAGGLSAFGQADGPYLQLAAAGKDVTIYGMSFVLTGTAPDSIIDNVSVLYADSATTTKTIGISRTISSGRSVTVVFDKPVIAKASPSQNAWLFPRVKLGANVTAGTAKVVAMQLTEIDSDASASFALPVKGPEYPVLPVMGTWQTGTWSACSFAEQTRSVTCVGSDGKTYSDASCTATKPATTQACTRTKTGGTLSSVPVTQPTPPSGGLGAFGQADGPYIQLAAASRDVTIYGMRFNLSGTAPDSVIDNVSVLYADSPTTTSTVGMSRVFTNGRSVTVVFDKPVIAKASPSQNAWLFPRVKLGASVTAGAGKTILLQLVDLDTDGVSAIALPMSGPSYGVQ